MCQRGKNGLCLSGDRYGIVRFLGVLFCLLFFCEPAWAHKVTIFAWVEGDTVFTQSKFSGGKRAQNSTVVVYDDEGNQLLEGKTDEQGAFSFKVPKKTALTVALKASMGHLAQWKVSAEEIAGEKTISDDGAKEDTVQEVNPSPASQAEADLPVAVSGISLSRKEIEALIDNALDKKLAPIIRMLTNSLDKGPDISDVVGGLGYIFGLVGVALYATHRSKRK